jgi:hypothetical protein
MPDSDGTFGITVPCETEAVTLAALQEFSYDQEAAIATVDVAATKARVRPAVAVRGFPGTAYTAGVAVVQSYGTIGFDNNNMFSLATPTVITIRTAGTYFLVGVPTANMASTNTSLKGELLINGVLAAQSKDASGIAGVLPPNPGNVSVLAPNMIVGDTVSLRITVTGVGNDSAFSTLYACLISYGA